MHSVRLDMRTACERARHMSSNVPDALHRKLKSRAADSGQTLSDFLLAELERLTARPTRDEMLTRIHGRRRVTLKTSAAARCPGSHAILATGSVIRTPG